MNFELDIDGSLVGRPPISVQTAENEPAITGATSTFEGGISTWATHNDSTVAHSTAQARTGTGSMSITATGATTSATARHVDDTANAVSVTPGLIYTVRGWFRAATISRSVQMLVNWYESNGSYISTTGVGSSLPDSTSAWTESSGQVTAPANAAFGLLLARVQNPGGAGEVHYVDDVTMARFLHSDDRLLIFGSVEFSGTLYLFGTRSGSTFVSSDLAVTWTELNPGGLPRECVSMAVYQNTVWLPATPGSANGGISWTPGGGAVAVVDMPRASACTVHKNRLYTCPGETATTNESRLTFSEAADFTIWPSTDFIDVAQGDGTTLNNVIVYQDNLLLFKQESTFVLAYDLDPADAILREINPVVGSNGSFGITQHENTVYCLHNGNVYEIVNYNFGLLNIKVPFEFDDTLPTGTSTRHEEQHVSLLGDRLVARYFNRTYVYGLRTKAWSEWIKTDDSSTVEWHIFGPLIRGPLDATTSAYSYYTSYSFDMSNDTGYKIIKIVSEHTVADSEGFGSHTIDCIATTKDYDMADPLRYKRLFWWGADLLTGNEIVAAVEPITLIFTPTWDQLGTLTWAELGTWNRPLTEPVDTMTTVPADGVFNTSKFSKFLKALRFRKVNFSVQLQSNGTVTEPAKIFSYIAVVRTKQTVSKQVT